jgi:hypothetical protein
MLIADDLRADAPWVMTKNPRAHSLARKESQAPGLETVHAKHSSFKVHNSENTGYPLALLMLPVTVVDRLDELLGDGLPWDTLENQEDKLAGLTAWLARHAAARLRARGASEEVLHRIRLLGLSGNARRGHG